MLFLPKASRHSLSCHTLLGKWSRLMKELFAQGRRRRVFLASNMDSEQYMTPEEKAKRAEDLVKGGALGKARTVLTSEGLTQGSTDDVKIDLSSQAPPATETEIPDREIRVQKNAE